MTDTIPRLIDLLADPTAPDVGHALADQVRFRSPYADYAGRADVAHLVGQIREVLSALRPVRSLDSGPDTMSEFEAEVAGTDRTGAAVTHQVQGVLVEHRDADGRLARTMLTLRPYAGLRASMRAMEPLMTASPLPSRRAR